MVVSALQRTAKLADQRLDQMRAEGLARLVGGDAGPAVGDDQAQAAVVPALATAKVRRS